MFGGIGASRRQAISAIQSGPSATNIPAITSNFPKKKSYHLEQNPLKTLPTKDIAQGHDVSGMAS